MNNKKGKIILGWPKSSFGFFPYHLTEKPQQTSWLTQYFFLSSLDAFYFLFLSKWLWLGLLIVCWIKVGTVGIIVLFLLSEESIQSFSVNHDVFLRCSLSCWATYLLFLVFWKILIVNQCWILSIACTYWDDHMLCS